MEKKKVLVKHLVASSYGGDFPPENAALFMKWFSDRLSDIPDEYRDSARIEIDTFICGDDEPTGSASEIILSYLRDETDDEMDRRITVGTSPSNTPIEELLALYEDEGCPHDDLEWVCSTALRIVETMPDSQARCLLHALAKHVAERYISRSTADPIGM